MNRRTDLLDRCAPRSPTPAWTACWLPLDILDGPGLWRARGQGVFSSDEPRRPAAKVELDDRRPQPLPRQPRGENERRKDAVPAAIYGDPGTVTHAGGVRGGSTISVN